MHGCMNEKCNLLKKSLNTPPIGRLYFLHCSWLTLKNENLWELRKKLLHLESVALKQNRSWRLKKKKKKLDCQIDSYSFGCNASLLLEIAAELEQSISAGGNFKWKYCDGWSWQKHSRILWFIWAILYLHTLDEACSSPAIWKGGDKWGHLVRDDNSWYVPLRQVVKGIDSAGFN